MSFTVEVQPLVENASIQVRVVCERGYRFLRSDSDVAEASFFMAHFTPLSGASRFERVFDTKIVYIPGGTARKFTAMVIANNMIMASDRRTVRNGRPVTGG